MLVQVSAELVVLVVLAMVVVAAVAVTAKSPGSLGQEASTLAPLVVGVFQIYLVVLKPAYLAGPQISASPGS